MRLLLDVHHSPKAAERLRDQGFDVLAASEDRRLASLPDDDLLRFAASEQRVLVTENVRDFDRIIRTWAASGDHHAGVIFTSPRRFHRGSLAYPENLVASLGVALLDPPSEPTDWVHWLQ